MRRPHRSHADTHADTNACGTLHGSPRLHQQQDGSDAIYLANADGSTVTRLTTGSAPAWAPDGRQIAFHLAGAIHVVNADGSGFRFVTQGFSPDWSPDGGRLVFSGITGIAVIDATGSNRREIFDGRRGGGGDAPAWSPDGRRIAFSVGSYVDSLDDFLGLWTINPDGSEARRLAELHDTSGPRWSPNGSEIAFVSAGGIGVARADGSGRRIVVSTSNSFSGVGWIPDGRLIYGRSNFAGPMRIFVHDAGVERQLVPDVTTPARANYLDSSPSWSRSSR